MYCTIHCACALFPFPADAGPSRERPVLEPRAEIVTRWHGGVVRRCDAGYLDAGMRLCRTTSRRVQAVRLASRHVVPPFGTCHWFRPGLPTVDDAGERRVPTTSTAMTGKKHRFGSRRERPTKLDDGPPRRARQGEARRISPSARRPRLGLGPSPREPELVTYKAGLWMVTRGETSAIILTAQLRAWG